MVAMILIGWANHGRRSLFAAAAGEFSGKVLYTIGEQN
jgi:hypothetical protein